MTAGNGADEAALEMSYSTLMPVDTATAERLLKETKQIMDRMGVVFFLRQGTCLGPVRDNKFIPWDDDLDIGSIMGLHGLDEALIDSVVSEFRNNGYFAKVERNDQYISVAMMKSSTRVDWQCYPVIDESIFHYPGVRFPARLFIEPQEIDFIGEKFLVPNPPEEYLRLKYGADWMTPKKSGYEKDILDMIPERLFPGFGGKLRYFLNKHILRWRAGRLRVLDHEERPVSGAEVVIAGVDRSRTNRSGYAKFYLPQDDWYALTISYDDHEEILYQEKVAPGQTYVYRPDPLKDSGRLSVLSTE